MKVKKNFGRVVAITCVGMLLFSTVFTAYATANSMNSANSTSNNTSTFNKTEFDDLIGNANILLASNDYKGALNYYDKATKIDPNNMEVLEKKGDTSSKLGKTKQALECYDKVVELNPNNVDVWKKKGDVLSELKKPIEALECYDKVVELNPNDTDTWKKKGDVLLNLRRPKQALECYDKVVELNPNNVDVWKKKGDALSKLGRLIEALECYNKVNKFNLEDAEVFSNIITKLNSSNEYNEALTVVDNVLLQNPTNYILWEAKTLIHEKLGNNKEANAYKTISEQFKKYYPKKFDTKDKDLYNVLYYGEELKSNPNNVDVWKKKGDALSRLGRLSEALECYDKVVELNPNDTDTWKKKGDLLQYLELPEEALECYGKIIELDPNNTEGLSGVLNNSNRHNALNLIEGVLLQNPTNYKLWEAKGQIHEKLGNNKEANAYKTISQTFTPKHWNWTKIGYYTLATAIIIGTVAGLVKIGVRFNLFKQSSYPFKNIGWRKS